MSPPKEAKKAKVEETKVKAVAVAVKTPKTFYGAAAGSRATPVLPKTPAPAKAAAKTPKTNVKTPKTAGKTPKVLATKGKTPKVGLAPISLLLTFLLTLSFLVASPISLLPCPPPNLFSPRLFSDFLSSPPSPHS